MRTPSACRDHAQDLTHPNFDEAYTSHSVPQRGMPAWNKELPLHHLSIGNVDFSIKSRPYFEMVATGTSPYQTRVWLPRALPELGKPKRKGMSSPLSTGLRSSGRGLRKWQEVHFPFIFFFFWILSFKGWWESAGWAQNWTEQTPQGGIQLLVPLLLSGAQPSATPLLNWYKWGELRRVRQPVPMSYCLTRHSHTSFEASGTKWLEDTSSLGKGPKAKWRDASWAGSTGPAAAVFSTCDRRLQPGPG